MARLTVHTTAGRRVAYRLDAPVVTIGRASRNAIVLFEDEAASRLHAELRQEEARWVLVDKQSTNGVEVNGERIRGKRLLQSGDEIRIGSHLLRFDLLDEIEVGADRDSATAVPESPGAVAAGAARRLVGESKATRDLLRLIEQLAPADSTVLIRGENGTGKELVAELLHALSPRRHGPLEIVNCPALPGTLVEAELFGVERGVATGVLARIGRLELAQGGTLLLDEVGDLDLMAQAKLLRFLQNRRLERVGGRQFVPIDTRILAATNGNLEDAVAAGRFRRDLYYRLNVIELEIPPLRARPADIPALAAHFLGQQRGAGRSLSAEALAALCSYPFPGNVRELQHLIERASVLSRGSEIGVDALPAVVRRSSEEQAETTLLLGRAPDAPGVPGQLSWESLRERFLRRELSREQLRAHIASLHAQCGRSYRGVAERLGAGDAFKPFLDFLRYHRLRLRD